MWRTTPGRQAPGAVIAALAFARARWRNHALNTRERIARFHAARLRRLSRHLSTAIPFYRDLPSAEFSHWPRLAKGDLLANFDRMNVAGISLAEAREAIARGDQYVRGYLVGRSTGTSGNYGYYVITDAERFVWLGTLLAAALPDALWRRHRVAIALPGLSELYRAAPSGSRIALRFFDATIPSDRWSRKLLDFDRDTIVATPKVLVALAEQRALRARNLFSAAETLDPLDRSIIERASGSILREIYMATEGLFGVSCRYGTLHLAEDVAHFEWEPAENGLVKPVVTDFTRRAQALARFRMNDLLSLSDAPCRCGSAFAAVARIEGRQDDAFELAAGDGGVVSIMPNGLRNAVVGADEAIDDFRIIQIGPSDIEVRVPATSPATVDAAVRGALAAFCAASGALPPTITTHRGVTVPLDRKLRRVERVWRDQR